MRAAARLLFCLLALPPSGAQAQDQEPIEPIKPEVAGRRERKRASGRGTFRDLEELPPGSWRLWWRWNRAALLRPAPRPQPTKPNAKSEPTPDDIENIVLPALLAALNRADSDPLVNAHALLSLGRVGDEECIGYLSDAVLDDLTTDDGARIELGDLGTGAALFALGLLRDLDDIGREGARAMLLGEVGASERSARHRAWAAIALGLRADPDAVRPLLEQLETQGAEPVAGAILLALGWSGQPYVRDLLESVCLEGRFRSRRASVAERAFAGCALARLGDPRSLGPVVAAIPAKHDRVVKASILFAAGELASKAEAPRQAEAVDALGTFLRKSGGQAVNEGLACMALGAIGSPDALRTLLRIAERGPTTTRPFAALAAGWRAGRGDIEDRERNRVANTLARLERRFKDAESRAAVLLARGLARDETAVPGLVAVAGSAGDPMVRGAACEALGLIGADAAGVREALLAALHHAGDPALNGRAATGLALLRVPEATRALLDLLGTSNGDDVRAAAAKALGRTGDRTALKPLAALLGDARAASLARAAAADALGRIINEAPAFDLLGRYFNYRSSVAELNGLLDLQ